MRLFQSEKCNVQSVQTEPTARLWVLKCIINAVNLTSSENSLSMHFQSKGLETYITAEFKDF